MPSAIGIRRRVPSFGPLACQRRPALIGAEHAAHRRRWNLLGLQPVPGIERVIPAPVAGEDVLVDPLVAGVDPALDRARVHVRRKAKGLVAGLPAAHAVGVGALQVGIEHTFVFPEAIEKRTRLGESSVLPRHHLRLRPVDVEDLRLPGLERGEVLVEAPLLDFPFFVVVRFEILADFREPVACNSRREHPADHRTPAVPNRLPNCLGDVALPNVVVIELGHHRAPCSDVSEDGVCRSTDVVPHVCVGAFQSLAIRRERALERDDLVTYIHFYPK